MLGKNGPAASDLVALCLATSPVIHEHPMLLFLDGTWKQAKEMRAASGPFLTLLSVIPVGLPSIAASTWTICSSQSSWSRRSHTRGA